MVGRLDGENGLLLTASIDHLFDRGFIGFDRSGELLISPVAAEISGANGRANPGPIERRGLCRRTAPRPRLASGMCASTIALERDAEGAMLVRLRGNPSHWRGARSSNNSMLLATYKNLGTPNPWC